MPDSLHNKLYSHKEIAELLHRATELQKGEQSPAESGLTLQEIEQVARESGINPSFIRAAAEEIRSGPGNKSRFHFLGGPFKIGEGSVVDGELTPDGWEKIVQEIRRLTGQNGTVQQLGNSQEWTTPPVTTKGQLIETRLTASPSGRKTRLFIHRNNRKIAFLAYYIGGMLIFMFDVTFGGNSAVPMLTKLLVTLGLTISGFFGIRFLLGKWIQSQHKKLGRFLQKFGAVLTEKPDETVTKERGSHEGVEITLEPEEVPDTERAGHRTSRQDARESG